MISSEQEQVSNQRQTVLRGITWNDPRGYGPMDAVGKAFAQTDAGRGTSVQWDIESLGDFESRPLSELADRYDLINMDHPHVGIAVSSGCLLPIDGLADEYVGPSLASYCMDGKYWCAPIDASCMVAALRPERVRAIPRRYDDVFALARDGVRIGASLAGVHALMAYLTLLAQHGHPLDADAEDGLPHQDALIQAAELLRELQQLFIAESLRWNPIDLLGAMASDQCDYAAFTYAYITYQERGVRFVPVAAHTDTPSRGAVIGGTGLGVSAKSNHPEAALAFARFVAGESVQTEIWPRFGGQPAHHRAWERLAIANEFYRDLKPAIKSSYVRPRFPGWIEFQHEAGSLICSWLGQRNANAKDLARQFCQLWIQAIRQSQSLRPC